MATNSYDYLIVGGGVIGLSIARELSLRYPAKRICLLEKEPEIASHASGRNSGVLHAGFYYASDSLKARFAKEGNAAMAKYCEANGLPVNRCGKIIVAANESELATLAELKARADRNGVELHWAGEDELARIEPNAKTHKFALVSPSTCSVDPAEICNQLMAELIGKGVDIYLGCEFMACEDDLAHTSRGSFKCGYFINAAGLYADRIAQQYGFGMAYTVIPFKGIYLKYNDPSLLSTNVYPVPNLKNPFLGVHFTKTVDGGVKIGPTAIPALWREHYSLLANFKADEFFSILYYETKLFARNAFDFRSLALEEMKKYVKRNLIRHSLHMVKVLDPDGFGEFTRPGIRAQLLHKESLQLVQDFVLEGDHRSMHVLNAVSPAFTCAFPFARHIVDEIESKKAGVQGEAS